MCGIAGILRFDGGQPAPLAGATRCLAHRGPDGSGVYAPRNQPVALAHTRLSVIDLDTGDQPMLTIDGAVAIVYNGEIYNFRELRKELAARGHAFRTRSDTETILLSYLEWGEACVERLDGMFAFALWDVRNQSLLLARDRVGKKPLFVYRDDRQLVFGSELKAVLAVEGVDARLDPAAFPLYLTYGYVPTPRTFYQNISKLPPAVALTAHPDGTTTERRYWDVHFGQTMQHGSVVEAAAALRPILRTAVQHRMVADVPVGAFLSGGLDSSIVVGLMSELSDRPVRTFSIGFAGDASYDETRYARMVANHFGTEHTEFVVEPDAFDIFDDLVTAYDEPFGDSSAIPTAIVSRLTRSRVTVALTGDGGDELFAGYARMHAAAASERIPALMRSAGGAMASMIPAGGSFRSLPARAARFLSAAAQPLPDRYVQWIGFFPEVQSLLRRDVFTAGADRAATRSSFRDHLDRHEYSTLGNVLTLNFRTYLLDDLLVKADRCSMMHSLELRSPFLDTALIEFAAGLPDRYRFKRGRTKYILRRAFDTFVPKAVIERSKMGFGVPIDLWFRTRWRPVTESRLLDPQSPLLAWLDAAAVAAVVNAHMSGRMNRGHQLWALLTLDGWLRTTNGCSQAPA
jgi:asparagine synthase (glutamine-hydrolysing)